MSFVDFCSLDGNDEVVGTVRLQAQDGLGQANTRPIMPSGAVICWLHLSHLNRISIIVHLVVRVGLPRIPLVVVLEIRCVPQLLWLLHTQHACDPFLPLSMVGELFIDPSFLCS